MAAEMAVPDKAELLALIAGLRARLTESALRDLRARGERLRKSRQSHVYTEAGQALRPRFERLGQLAGSYAFTRPERLFDPHKDRLSRLQERMGESVRLCLSGAENRFGQAAIKLEALSPLATLARGYSICVDGLGRVLVESSQVSAGDTISVSLSKGGLSCVVKELK